MSKSPVEFTEREKVILGNLREAIVCTTGLSFEKILTKNRLPPYISMRAVFFKIADEEKIEESKVARYTGYDHATVIHSLNNFQTYCSKPGIKGTTELYHNTLEHYRMIQPSKASMLDLIVEMNEKLKRIENLLNK